jgi:hypothetical protein
MEASSNGDLANGIPIGGLANGIQIAIIIDIDVLTGIITIIGGTTIIVIKERMGHH